MTKNDRTLVADVHLTVPDDEQGAGGQVAYQAGTAFGDLPNWAQDLLDGNPAAWDERHGGAWGVQGQDTGADVDAGEELPVVGPGLTVMDDHGSFEEVPAPAKASGSAKKSQS